MNLYNRKNAAFSRLKLKSETLAGTVADWDPIDIIAAVHKSGISLAALSRGAGYSDGAASVALYKPWPALEQIIAERIGCVPAGIWPSRYDANGAPRRLRKRSTRRRRPHVQTSAGV